MNIPNLYIISGCNGAGKTTASFTILPEMLGCDEFINADELARGLSPLKPEKAAIEAGRLMLSKINRLITIQKDIAFETTLSSKTYANTIIKAKQNNYRITLVFFWLDSPGLAIERVKTRVVEGGHDIPSNIIIRRYYSGLRNLFNLYIPLCDYWMILNNSQSPSELVAEGYRNNENNIINIRIFETIKKMSINDQKE